MPNMLFMASLLLALSAVPALSQDGVWTIKKPLSAPRNEVALAATGGKLYVVGGSVGGNAVPLVDEYDPPSDGWRGRAPMPKGLDHLGITVIGGKIITVGGFIGSVHRGAVSDVYEYNPAADTWRTLAPMKNPRGSVAAAVLDGKLHAVGGRSVDNTFTVGTHEVFDPATGQWIEGAPLPQPRDHMALVAIDGKLHAVGGRITNPASRVDAHDVYDPKTNSWSPGPPLPTARSGLAYALYQGMMVVLGGELAPNTFPNNEAYDSKSMRWRTLMAMPHGRHECRCDRQEPLCGGGFAQARFGRGDRSVDRFHDALTARKGPAFPGLSGPIKVPLTTNL